MSQVFQLMALRLWLGGSRRDVTSLPSVSILFDPLTLNVKALRSFEMPRTTNQTTRRHIPEDKNLKHNSFFLDCLTPEAGADRLSRNVGN